MKQIKVKVFDAYSVSDSDEKFYYANIDIFDYHNQIIRKDGIIKGKFKPLEHNLIEKIKYELDEDEQLTYKMIKDTTKKAKDLYDSCKRKEDKYKKLLISKININEDLYDGEKWKCDFSPVGHCIYKYDENGSQYECIFCGEPEERK